MDVGRPRVYDNILFCSYKISKKMFSKSLKRIAREYENNDGLHAVRSAELDRNTF